MLSLVFCILPSLVRTTVELSCGGDVLCFPAVSTHQNKTKTLTGPCIRTTSSIKLIIAFTYVKTHIASIFEIKNFGMGPFIISGVCVHITVCESLVTCFT